MSTPGGQIEGILHSLKERAKELNCLYNADELMNQIDLSEDEVLSRLDQKMTTAFSAVADLSEETGEYMRDAAYMIAIQRVATACHLRGWA